MAAAAQMPLMPQSQLHFHCQPASAAIMAIIGRFIGAILARGKGAAKLHIPSTHTLDLTTKIAPCDSRRRD